MRSFLGSVDNPELMIYRVEPERVRFMREWAWITTKCRSNSSRLRFFLKAPPFGGSVEAARFRRLK